MALFIRRIIQLRNFMFLLGCLLIIRLLFLQVMQGEQLATWGLSSRVEELSLSDIRGDILDCNNRPFTNSEGRYNLVVFPSQIEDRDNTSERLENLLKISKTEISNKIKGNIDPFCLETDLTEEKLALIHSWNIPGVTVVRETLRYKPGLASHVIGYINRADNEGVSGVEALFDGVLKGNHTQAVAALVDGGDKVIPGLGYKRLASTVNTSHVVLTLDRNIQTMTESIIDKTMTKGCIIVLRPGTGEILALASRPNFDANRLSTYLVHNTAPLVNRAITAYQPGSVFKLVVAAAALEKHVVNSNTVFYDPGYIDINNIRFKGWDFEQGGRGKISFNEAMAYSSNPTFIEVGQKVGAYDIAEYARKLGFGKNILYLPGEVEGNIPDPESLYPADVANISIGQGTIETTPLQMAACLATIVNDGIEVKPYLISKLITSEDIVVKKYMPTHGERVVSTQTARQIKNMLKCVTSYGTGQAAYVNEYGSAGKTGTAETGKIDNNGKSINHAWFVGYAPLDTPKFIVVIFVEDGMSGGDVAAPIFKELVQSLLKDFS